MKILKAYLLLTIFDTWLVFDNCKAHHSAGLGWGLISPNSLINICVNCISTLWPFMVHFVQSCWFRWALYNSMYRKLAFRQVPVVSPSQCRLKARPASILHLPREESAKRVPLLITFEMSSQMSIIAELSATSLLPNVAPLRREFFLFWKAEQKMIQISRRNMLLNTKPMWTVQKGSSVLWMTPIGAPPIEL